MSCQRKPWVSGRNAFSWQLYLSAVRKPDPARFLQSNAYKYVARASLPLPTRTGNGPRVPKPETMQRKSIQRKTVYGVTIVAILGLATAFAIAGSFTFTPTATQGQNGYSVTTGSTMWSFDSARAGVDPSGSCPPVNVPITISTPGTSPADTVTSVSGASGGACADTNVAEEFNFTASVVSTPTSDGFTVFSYTAPLATDCSASTAGVAYVTVTTSGGSATATSVQFDLWVDYGPAPVAVCGVDIAVNGS